MKNIMKISLCGLAFTMEEEGHALLEKYLNRLKKYYSKQQNGIEVVEGIEERIAELLRERLSTPEEVVGKELIQEVMDIMGSPEDIESEDSGENCRSRYGDGERDADRGADKGAASGGKPKRRLYRNVNDKVLGGVCSGIASYLNVEPLLFRVIFVVLALFSSFGFGISRFWFPHHFGISVGGWAVLAYIILWMVIPAAKTVAQKCEMRGERPDFSGIQERVKRGAEQFEREVRRGAERIGSTNVAKGVGRVIAFCVGVVFLLISIPVLVVLPISMIFYASWIWGGVLPQGLASIVAFHGSVLWIQILGALVLVLPFVGMLFAGISLIFNLKPKKIRPGLIIFTTWLLSVFVLVIMVATALRPYYGGVEEMREEVPVFMHSDTLYVQYTTSQEVPHHTLGMRATSSEAFLFWFEGERRSLEIVVYPHIRIVRVDSSQEMRIAFMGYGAGRYVDEAYSRAEESIPAHKIQDSLLMLLPESYSRTNKWQGNWGEVVVYLPKGKEVMLTSPYQHHFDRSAPQISKGAIWRNFHPRRLYGGNQMERNRSRMEERWSRWEDKWSRWEERWND